MVCRAYIGKIKPGKVRDYIKAHEKVWPELIDAMKKAGLKEEICFVYGNHIFIYREGADIDAALEKLGRDPLSKKWEASMEPLLEKPAKDLDDFFPQMREVFRMSAGSIPGRRSSAGIRQSGKVG